MVISSAFPKFLFQKNLRVVAIFPGPRVFGLPLPLVFAFRLRATPNFEGNLDCRFRTSNPPGGHLGLWRLNAVTGCSDVSPVPSPPPLPCAFFLLWFSQPALCYIGFPGFFFAGL